MGAARHERHVVAGGGEARSEIAAHAARAHYHDAHRVKAPRVSRRDDDPADDPACAQVVERPAGLIERARLDRDRRDLPGLDKVHHLARLGGRAHVAPHDGQRAQGEHRYRQGEASADQAHHDGGAALGYNRLGHAQRLVGAGEVHRRTHPAAGCLDDGLARTGVRRVESLLGAELQGRLALGRIDVGHKDRCVGERTGELQPHHADPAQADDEKRAQPQEGDGPLDGAVAGEPGAHERPGDLWGDALHVEQVAGVRHQDVRGVAAVDRDAERARRVAQMLVAACAHGARAAADPRIDGVAYAGCDALGVGASRLDGAGDLVPKGEGEGAEAAHVELLLAAQGEIAVLQVQIGVAHAAMGDAQQHLAAPGLGRLGLGGLERLAVLDQRLPAHVVGLFSQTRSAA